MIIARLIADSGDLDHEIAIDRSDEIGELARTFANMVTYLKEMASVSEAIAGGNLGVDVQPRSKNDTLGKAFARMIEGLRKLVRNGRDAAQQVASASNQVSRFSMKVRAAWRKVSPRSERNRTGLSRVPRNSTRWRRRTASKVAFATSSPAGGRK